MILHALTEYYDRLAADPDSGIAPIGWQQQRIGWIIILNEDGSLKNLERTHESYGKTLIAKQFCVPEGEHTNAITPCLLWDNPEYVLALPKEKKGSTQPEKAKEKAKEKQLAFINRLQDFNLPALAPIITFLTHNPLHTLSTHPFFDELKTDASAIITFRLASDIKIVCERDDVKEQYNKNLQNSNTLNNKRCLITGEICPTTTITPSIPLRNGHSRGCKLVAFQKDSGFDSYNKEQGANAPIGTLATFKYTTALKYLLSSESNHFQLGEETLLFWAKKKDPIVNAITDFFGYKDHDNPNAGVESVKAIFNTAHRGALPKSSDENRFYMLGLQPNSARIAIRLWVELTITELAAHLAQFFKDMEITRKNPNRPIPLRLLLTSISPRGEIKSLPPKIAGDMFYAILMGNPLPDCVAQAILRRLKSDPITAIHSALLKTWLRKKHSNYERMLTPMLNTENPSIAYRLGRLFALLEKSQEDALGNVNASIKDRYYATASSSPSTVFPTLLRLNLNHMRKLSEGREIYFEKLKGDILSQISTLPSHLNLPEQGEFALGYYQQRQDFFTKKQETEHV